MYSCSNKRIILWLCSFVKSFYSYQNTEEKIYRIKQQKCYVKKILNNLKTLGLWKNINNKLFPYFVIYIINVIEFNHLINYKYVPTFIQIMNKFLIYYNYLNNTNNDKQK